MSPHKESFFIRLARVIHPNGLRFPLVPRAVLGSPNCLGGDAAQSFAEELVSNIPLPIDAKIMAAARGIQVTGILLCVVNGNDLEQCQCFIDLALELTQDLSQEIARGHRGRLDQAKGLPRSTGTLGRRAAP